jgi:multicomponent Na+:H+ antiporter subunit D
MGIALAGNLLTFFVFYEMLTLVTYPLVVHRGRGRRWRRAASTCSTRWRRRRCCWRASPVAAHRCAGPVEFASGGVLGAPAGDSTGRTCSCDLRAADRGLGVKAALVPLHGWLPHGDGGAGAGERAAARGRGGQGRRVRHRARGLRRVRRRVRRGWACWPLAVARRSPSSTARCGRWRRTTSSGGSPTPPSASSPTSPSARRSFGPLATIGGLVHLVHQGIMKITLFFCAGNVAETLGVTGQRDGRRRPPDAGDDGGLHRGGVRHDRGAAAGRVRQQVVPGARRLEAGSRGWWRCWRRAAC